MTALISPSKSTGSTMMFSGRAEPVPDVTSEIIGRHVLDEDALAFVDALTDEAFARAELLRPAFARRREARHVFEQRLIVDRFVQVEHGRLRIHERREFRHDQLRNGLDVFLTLQHAREAREIGLEPILLGVHARRVAQVADHLVDVFRQLSDFAARIDLDRSRQIALGDRRRDAADGADLRGQLCGELVDVIGQVFPQTGGARHDGLTAEFAFEAHFARDGRGLIREASERDDHTVDRVGEFGDLAFRFERQLTAKIAVGDAGDDAGDTADLFGEVTRHLVDGVGEIFPRARDARHLGLTTELPFGADLTRNARHFAGERVELIDHRVDRVFEFENFAERTSTVIFFERSPFATAVVTFAMLRTWAVRFEAIELTESVRSFHVPATPGTTA